MIEYAYTDPGFSSIPDPLASLIKVLNGAKKETLSGRGSRLGINSVIEVRQGRWDQLVYFLVLQSIRVLPWTPRC